MALGSQYSAITFGWRVPHNTISVIVREVCEAIFPEYVDVDGWRTKAHVFPENGISLTYVEPFYINCDVVVRRTLDVR